MDNFKRFITTDYFGEEVLRYNLEPHEVLNTFKYEMSTSNKELPLVQMQCEYVNGNEAFIYKIANRMPLSKVVHDEPYQILMGLFQSINELSEYHIGLDDLILDESYIFYKPASKRIEFLFLPIRDVKTGAGSTLRQTFIKIIKLPGFSKKIEGEKLAEIFELLYEENILGKELIQRLEGLIRRDKGPGVEENLLIKPIVSSQSSVKNEKPLKLDVPKKELTVTKPLKFKWGAFNLIICLVLGIVGIIVWFSPLSFEGKLGVDLFCIAGGLLLYQKKLAQPISKKGNEVQSKKKVTPKIPKPINAKESNILEKNIVNEITGEINEIERPFIKPVKDDKTVFLSEENTTVTLWIDDGQNKVFNLQHMQTIGRNNAVCQIILEHMSVGRLHAEIHLNQGHVYIKDLNSMNGTFVNQSKIKSNEYIEIRLGDQLKFGEVKAYLR